MLYPYFVESYEEYLEKDNNDVYYKYGSIHGE